MAKEIKKIYLVITLLMCIGCSKSSLFPSIQIKKEVNSEEIDFSDKLYPVKVNGKYGYIDYQGKIKIKPKFFIAHDFREGLALVALPVKKGEKIESKSPSDILNKMEIGPVEGRYGFIGKNGEWVIKPDSNYALNFSEGLAWVKRQEKEGFIDKMGKFVLVIKRAEGYFSDGYAVMEFTPSHFGFINKEGEMVIASDYYLVDRFHEGLALVHPRNRIEDKLSGCFIDKENKQVGKLFFESGKKFSEGMAAVQYNGKWGFIDKAGKIIIECKYDKVFNFMNGLAPVKDKKKWGFIDKAGEIVIECKYDFVWNFSEGVAPVEKDKRWSFIDKHGEIVFDTDFDDAYFFNNGLAHVAKGHYSGYMNKKGELVWWAK